MNITVETLQGTTRGVVQGTLVKPKTFSVTVTDAMDKTKTTTYKFDCSDVKAVEFTTPGKAVQKGVYAGEIWTRISKNPYLKGDITLKNDEIDVKLADNKTHQVVKGTDVTERCANPVKFS